MPAQSLSVILVEDDPIVRDIAAEAFRDAGFVVTECGSADEAMILVEQGGFGAVVTDVQLPGTLDGLDLAAQVASRWPGVPVVVTSGGLRIGARLLPAGAVFLQKPWHPSALVEQVLALRVRPD